MEVTRPRSSGTSGASAASSTAKSPAPVNDYTRAMEFISQIPSQPQRRTSVLEQLRDLVPFATRAGLHPCVLTSEDVDLGQPHTLAPHLQTLWEALAQQPMCVTVNYKVHLGMLRSLCMPLGLYDAASHIRSMQDAQ